MARIYISYAREDSEIVGKVVKVLRSAGHEVWTSRTGLGIGRNLSRSSEQAISDADIFLVFISHGYLDSDVLGEELDFAIRWERKKIITILVDGSLFSGRAGSSVLRTTLLGQKAIDLSHHEVEHNFERGADELLGTVLGTVYQIEHGGEQPKSAMNEEDEVSEYLPDYDALDSVPGPGGEGHAPGRVPKNGGGVRDAGPKSKPPARPKPRYANVVLMESGRSSVLKPSAPIERGSLFRLRLDIGRLSRLSAVRSPVPVPAEYLPPDIWLDVMVTSTDFEVGRSQQDLDASSIAQGKFFLPGDGGPAHTESEKRYMHFTLRAPGRDGPSRARIAYYFRNHLVQSQLLTLKVGSGESLFQVDPDYALSESLSGLESLPSRQQLSILTNDNGNGSHQFIVRAENASGNLLAEPLTFELNAAAIGRVVEELRIKLRRPPIIPTQRKRSKNELKADLKALAPLGRQLYTEILGKHFDKLYPKIYADDLVVQVVRPGSSRFAFPWSLVYDIPLQSNTDWKYCSLVEQWDGKSDLIGADTQHCPTGKHAPNTLCPFGFWGYRYAIEQLSRTEEPVRTISAPPQFEMVVGETQYDISPRELKTHVDGVQALLTRAFPRASLTPASDVQSIQDLLCKDSPLIYFYCHGERPNAGSPDTYLGVGRREMITSGDFIGWVQTWWDQGLKVWDKVRPLIFINACHSLDINPDSLVTYLDAFIGTGHAAGVIGTEVRVNQKLAMEAALEFFTHFFGGETVGRSLHRVRMSFLRSGNLFGLVYTPYCWSDLKLVKS